MTIFEKVKSLELPTNQYVVFGSGPLAAHRIREAGDIDLFVTTELFEELKSRGWEVHKFKADSVEYLVHGDFEVLLNWKFGDYNPTVEELIAVSEIINGVPFAPLTEVLKWKKIHGRHKDLRDVRLIEAHLAKQG